MFLFIRISTILSLVFFQTSIQARCNNSICNYEAVCILKNGEHTCECIEQYFVGDFCSTRTEHCSSNPCQNGGTCQSYPGHYNCECPPGFAGQTCVSKQAAFKGLHFHYNHIAAIGTEQSIILLLENLGSVETLMEFYTADYIIDGIVFTSTSGHFKESSDLKSLGSRLGIKHSDSLPYTSGFYRISKASFWKLGIHSMTLDLSDFGLSAENFFRATFKIFVYDPSGIECFPEIHLPHCLNPRKPLHMDIQTFNYIEPIVDKRCKENSHLKIKWSVRNYIDTVVLYKFPKQSRPALTIPPYTMWFNYRDDFVQSYLIQGDVNEIDSRGNHISKTTLRCYVFVDSKPTTAYILGGTYREVNFNKELILDGSMSRDYARRPNRDQKLVYSWSCTSKDTENQYCLQSLGNESRIIFPPQALQLHQTYHFTLRVTSSINIFSTHRTVQAIRAISDDSLMVHFSCLRNCEHGKFSAGKVIHLKLECIKCSPGNITYSITNNLDIEVSNGQHVIFIEQSKKEVYLRAEASLGVLKGSTSIQLKLNQPPDKGTCSISPTSGIEYQTIFKIFCSGYEDEDKPIDYKFWLGNNILDHSGDEALSTRLFTTSGQNCEVRISICDDIGACTEVHLVVTLEPTNVDGSWAAFLSQNGSNLKELIQNGDRSSAIALIRTVIRHMSPEEGHEIAKHVVVSLRNFEPNRLVAVEQILAIGNELLGSIKLTSESVLLVSELFFKVTEGFLRAMKNHEILELQLENHELMLGSLGQAMARTSEEAEQFPTVHDAESIPPEDPFKENYSDYGELDVKDVVHISNWLKSFQRMHKCLQVIGVVSAFIQLPGETPLVIKRKGITSRTFVVDNSEAMSLSWNEPKTVVDFTNAFFKSLGRDPIAIQVTIFDSNPLWWNPEQYKINTQILSVGAYTKNLNSLNPKTINSHFSFYMELKTTSDEIVTNGRVWNALEMLLYERDLPANSVLVVIFSPLEYDISVLLMIGDRPRSFMLKDATVVQASGEKTTLYLINNSLNRRKAFLAIASKFKAEFSFALVIRMCTTWNTNLNRWTSENCWVGYQTNTTHIHCACRHLSMFGAKVYPTFGQIQASSSFLHNLNVNYDLIWILIVFIVLMFALLWFAWSRDVNAAGNLVILDEGPKGEPTHEYLVTIYTSGHMNAGTTSNVSIKLHGSLANSRKYKLYSRPGRSCFYRNAQTSFTIFISNDLGTLQAVSLYHDDFGRYPQWNCHMVKIREQIKQNVYIFMVNRWITGSEPILVPLAKKEDLQSKWSIFRHHIADAFANFYAEQPLASVRIYGQLTAVEKTALLILKFCITIMGTLIAFGPTTIFTYEMERETYYSMLLDLEKILFIASACHITGVVLSELIEYLILKIRNNSILDYNLVLR